MFGKRSSGPKVKSKAPTQAGTADAPADKPELPEEALTSVQAVTPGHVGSPYQWPPSGDPDIPSQSPQEKLATGHSELFGDEQIRHNETKQTIFTSLVEAVDLTELGKLDAAQVREEITEIIGEIIALKAMVLSSAEQQELITDICNDVLGLGPLEPLLERDDIDDIMVNGAEKIYIEVNGQIEFNLYRSKWSN